MPKILFNWENFVDGCHFEYRVVQKSFGDCVLESRTKNAMGELVWVKVPFGDSTEVAFWDLVKCIENGSVRLVPEV